jgi:hypothetical protein
MGNDISTQQDKSDLSNIHKIVNHIATDYIFTSNFKDMENLGDVKYCNNLVILTSRIIEENLNDLDVEYLSQHIKDGNVVDEMTKDKVIYLKKNKIPKLDVKNETQKRRLCVGIARFYVKIAHIFASILKTINPTISYVDNKGNAGETSLMDKHKLPEDADMKMNTISLCSKRLDTLVNNNNYDINNKEVTVNPDYCNMNADKNNATLLDEPGMVELEKLYNDKYDYDKGGYIGMSDTMKNKYKRDLEIFYKAFSDNSEPFDSKKIKKFSDIKLREHHKKKGCSDGEDGEYLKKYKGELKDKLYGDYANHVKKMMDNTKKNQDQLLSVIDKLFVFVNITDETKKDKKVIMINPTLTETTLQNVVEESRRIIMNLYITCEKDFLKGLEIFEAIVEKQISDTTMERINNLPIHREQIARARLEHNEIEKKERDDKERDDKERDDKERDDKERDDKERDDKERDEKERSENNENDDDDKEMTEDDDISKNKQKDNDGNDDGDNKEPVNKEKGDEEKSIFDRIMRRGDNVENQDKKVDADKNVDANQKKPEDKSIFDGIIGNRNGIQEKKDVNQEKKDGNQEKKDGDNPTFMNAFIGR